jgi:hypothetical protein
VTDTRGGSPPAAGCRYNSGLPTRALNAVILEQNVRLWAVGDAGTISEFFSYPPPPQPSPPPLFPSPPPPR